MDQKLLSILGGDTHHYPYALEKQYPRIFATLMLLWDTPEMESYLTKLMVNERIDREGFPPNVAAEIVHLSLVHAGQHHKKDKDDVWSPEARVFSNFDPVATGTRNLLAWPNIPRVVALEIQEQGVACRGIGRLFPSCDHRQHQGGATVPRVWRAFGDTQRGRLDHTDDSRTKRT